MLFKKILKYFLNSKLLEKINIKLNAYNEELQKNYNIKFAYLTVIYRNINNKIVHSNYLNKSLNNIVKIYTNELQLINKLKQKLNINLKTNNLENN